MSVAFSRNSCNINNLADNAMLSNHTPPPANYVPMIKLAVLRA